jgi:hypothetical protein
MGMTAGDAERRRQLLADLDRIQFRQGVVTNYALLALGAIVGARYLLAATPGGIQLAETIVLAALAGGVFLGAAALLSRAQRSVAACARQLQALEDQAPAESQASGARAAFHGFTLSLLEPIAALLGMLALATGLAEWLLFRS